MTLVIDGGPLVAIADREEPRRAEIVATLAQERGRLLIPSPVTAEIDYLLGRQFGRPARRVPL